MRSDLVTVQVGDPSRPREVFIRPGSSDEEVLRHIFAGGEYDMRGLTRFQEILGALQAIVDSGARPLIIDAGANIGMASVFFNYIMPHARIVAIEPEEENCEILCLNLQGMNAVIIKAALASTSGSVKVVESQGGYWAFQTERTEEEAEGSVPCLTIGDIYARELSDRVKPFIVKIDIEGFEEDVFSANTDWVDQTPIVFAELHDWVMPKRGTSKPFLRCMVEKDRDFILSGQSVFSLRYNLL